jgi:hypothetical protein
MAKINEINNLEKNRAYRINIYAFSNADNDKKIQFPAFITDFTDSYKSNWKEEEVYGKMDPIATFKNTTRTITLTFDVPSDSLETARSNLREMDRLIRGLYPIYDNGIRGTAVLVSPPMFRVRFSNLVRNVAQVENSKTLRTGLLCYIKNFDFKPKVDSGFFVSGESLYPKLLVANLNLSIIHEHALGKYNNEGAIEARANFDRFPHEIGAAARQPYVKKYNSTSTQTTKTSEEAEREAVESLCMNSGD